MAELEKKQIKKGKLDRGSTLFYVLMMSIPVAQFLVFYIAVNFRSFLYAFQDIEYIDDVRTVAFTLKNFTRWFTSEEMRIENLMATTKMSLIYYAINLAVSIPLGLLFAYYVFKNHMGAKFFRVMLFVPSIIPAAALVLSYKLILQNIVPELLHNEFFMFDKHEFFYIVFYNLFISFGASVLMYANKMFEIPPEIIEAAELDGATGIKEFLFIVLPLTYPTLSVFLITGVATLFTNQYNIFLFRPSGGLNPLGYFLYDKASGVIGNEQDVPNISALGLILTAIAVPLTFLVKYCLDKFGPKEE